MVAEASSFSEVLPRFLAFIGDDILVGHNIHSFDMKFLMMDLVNEVAITKQDFDGFSADFREQMFYYCDRAAERFATNFKE